MADLCDQGRNTGVKAVFGGAQKKPLMTKVSMRHLNEIIRERNQYSRDAMEAWQDFINLKGRMDTELTKVSKRNNFLVEELESWKQQFLKFQAFAETLTKETQDLKVKIEGHKRENRRLTGLIEQHKDDSARLTVRLGGTEKQRDDALEALVLQQEIAEELERERKRNKKELSALQHTNNQLLRQRDEAQRVVLHLRALIDGQAHHMEHIVKTLNDAPEVSETVEGVDGAVSPLSPSPAREQSEMIPSKRFSMGSRSSSRSSTRASTRQSRRVDSEEATEDMETRLLNNPSARKRLSQLSMTDVADRHLRDKTDAIAYIIRNISEQCAAAVEGLHLAQRADTGSSVADEEAHSPESRRRSKGKKASLTPTTSEDGTAASGSEYGGSDVHSETSQSYLHPHGRASSIPPTPDLMHGNRSSTSMSVASASTAATSERHSIQSQWRTHLDEDIPEVPTRIVGEHYDAGVVVGEAGEEEPVTKFSPTGLERRTSNMRLGAA